MTENCKSEHCLELHLAWDGVGGNGMGDGYDTVGSFAVDTELFFCSCKSVDFA
jgi:hypothetical protein